METRHCASRNETKRFTTEELRSAYLIESLFEADRLTLTYTHEDRMLIGGAVPVKEPVILAEPDIKTGYFLERREAGIINIGGPGTIEADGEAFHLQSKDCLYLGMGKKEVVLKSENPQHPARYYILSTLAHKEFPAVKIGIDEAAPVHLGEEKNSNKRTIYKYIHAGGAQSSQLMMGMTLLAPNCMWNTMPAHIHDRRSEVYLYFDMDVDTRVFHFMGEPSETRHLIVSNEQAVISPSWSIHSGIGTSNYTFIWAMAGENYTFDDMEHVGMKDLR
ncbi:5-dehydro-4-deoxy-D-glucuronate isomerase [Bacillus mangrovi]|uniref:4-deoxy-L-threo-5-hexosulose-uronate ketol-isomerase n=1 Tax=Metabacillus mangrovi TaxID=1491830 RepID=A0A7X2V4E8_9BACI|nr:5-dehydro-4-deoxy-D-glucuronate isomerase [Metabacillus mangrovi]MTH53039.1 5-dehydro-4-deoxy-D-glucuronate isomerase [Metabacillus mangrovi]